MVLGGYRERTPGVTVPMQRARVIFHDKDYKLDGPIVCFLARNISAILLGCSRWLPRHRPPPPVQVTPIRETASVSPCTVYIGRP